MIRVMMMARAKLNGIGYTIPIARNLNDRDTQAAASRGLLARQARKATDHQQVAHCVILVDFCVISAITQLFKKWDFCVI